jgi:parvulin-like peptidyl-prolyl isomerase
VSTRTHAGDLGFVTRDQVERPLEDALFAAKSGPDVRQIVRLAQGYAVVDILGRQDAPTQEADKQKALDDTLKRKQALAREFTTWFPEVEKSYPVERLLPYRR